MKLLSQIIRVLKKLFSVLGMTTEVAELKKQLEDFEYIKTQLRQMTSLVGPFREWLEKQQTRPEIMLIEQTSDWLYEHLKELPNWAKFIYVPFDSRYWVCSKADFLKAMQWDTTNGRKYFSNLYDCENFALTFKTNMNWNFKLNNVGLVVDHSSKHAYNIVIFDDGSIELFEPQSDTFPEIGQDKLHQFKRGVLLI